MVADLRQHLFTESLMSGINLNHLS